jgi:hypothetical protein
LSTTAGFILHRGNGFLQLYRTLEEDVVVFNILDSLVELDGGEQIKPVSLVEKDNQCLIVFVPTST